MTDRKQYIHDKATAAKRMTHIKECVESFVGAVVILRYILAKLGCGYRMTTTDMIGLGRPSAPLVPSVTMISSGIDLMNGLLFTN